MPHSSANEYFLKLMSCGIIYTLVNEDESLFLKI